MARFYLRLIATSLVLHLVGAISVFAQSSSEECYNNGTLLYWNDFGGNEPGDARVSTTDFLVNGGGTSGLSFSSIGGQSGHYAFEKNTTMAPATFWASDDHTYWKNPDKGYYMYIDPAPSQLDTTLYEITINDLCPQTQMMFSAWATDLGRFPGQARPKMKMRITNAATGALISETGDILLDRATSQDNWGWKQYFITFTTPPGVTSVKFTIINRENNNIGNDWALDDISVHLCTNSVETKANKYSDANVFINDTRKEVKFEGSFVNDAKFGNNLTSYWLYSETGNIASLADWAIVNTKPAGACATNATWTHNCDLASAKLGYYRLVVGNGANVLNTKCRAASKVFRVQKYPDNIDDPTCAVENKGTTWSIMESLPINKTDLVHNYGPIRCGDIDGDGKIEIIALANKAGSQNGYDSNGIKIFTYESDKIKLKKHFTVPATASFGASAIARYNNKGYIIFVGVDRYLYAYTPNGELIWKSDAICSATVINIVNIADFNNDGIPEVYVGNKIFSMASGKLLCSGTGNTGLLGNSDGNSTIAIDMDNDQYKTLELVAGTQIYKVTIPQNGTTSAGCSMTLINDLEMKKTLPSYALKDGMTQVMDMDNDGQLEVVVTTISGGRLVVYIWKPQPGGNSYIMASYLVPTTGVARNGIPMIGDIDKDGLPEIVFITASHMYALDFNPNLTTPAASTLTRKWTLPHSDGSQCTGMVLFDFDLDGTAEIIYRDQTTLRIIDGSGSAPEATETFTNVLSHTLREYPIVADINGDGQAEIIVTGWDGLAGAADNQNNYLRVFKSGGFRWAPARSVWNQYNYNAVNVNEDLTIPAVQFPIVTQFAGEDGIAGNGDDVRVFNNFRQQQTYLNRNGIPYLPAPEIMVVNESDIRFSYNVNEDKLYISNLKVKNDGQAGTNVPLWITTYKDVVLSAKKDIYKYDNPVSIAPNEVRVINFTIDNFSSWMPVNKLIIKVNDLGDGENAQPVCRDCCTNNESGSFINVNFEGLISANKYKHCENGIVTFTAKTLPGTGVEYKWYKPDGVSIGETKSVTYSPLALGDGGQYAFTADKVNGNISVSYKLPYLSVAPKVMHWKGNAANKNWNDLGNWLDGSKTAIKAVPAECTTVHIPAVATNYPQLQENTAAVTTATDFSLYGQPEVDKIVYHYGSETAYPHKLKYNKAYVQYNFGHYNPMPTTGVNQPTNNNSEGATAAKLNRNQWYLLSAPLKKTASGDFSFGGYPATWQAVNQTITESSGNLPSVSLLTGFAQNDVDLSTQHNVIGLKVGAYSKNVTGLGDHKYLSSLGGILELPYIDNSTQQDFHPMHSYDPIGKTSSFYYFDNTTLQQLASPVGQMKRDETDAFKFVFEGNTANVLVGQGSPQAPETVLSYKLKVKVSGASRKVLIGNPFMSAIDMQRFKNANFQKIEGLYYQLYENGLSKQYNYSAANNGINSLQAFVVTLAGSAQEVELYFPLEGNFALTGTATGKIPRRLETPGALSVTASNTAGKGGDYAELTAGQVQAANVSKLISEEGHALPEAFFIDPTGNSYNLIQVYEQGMNEVGLGVKCSDTQNELTLTFDRVAEFSQLNDAHPILVDKLLGVEQDLTKNSTYRFRQHTAANPQSQYADKKRFAIRFGESSGVNSGDDNLQVIYTNGHLQVKTTVAATQVEVYNLGGQLLFNSGTVSTTNYQQDLPLAQGGYIVKVKTDNKKTVSKKIMAL